MSAQRYISETAKRRMAQGNCPECGNPPSAHGGRGAPGCSLTDNGVAARIDQYRKDEKAAGNA